MSKFPSPQNPLSPQPQDPNANQEIVLTFVGKSTPEALQKVKETLGPNAYIISSRYIKGWPFGLRGKSCVEIKAKGRPKSPHLIQKNSILLPSPEEENLKNKILEWIKEENNPHYLYQLLLRKGFPPHIATKFIQDILPYLENQPPKSFSEQNLTLKKYLSQLIPTTPPALQFPPNSPYLCILIGPTGVGKTTTIAKLAARYKFDYNKTIGLLTLDTYRIAAPEQLQEYAKILQSDFQIVQKIEQIPSALKAFSQKDIVFIDTAGCSQKDIEKIQTLKNFLLSLKPHEIHLVLSATSHYKHLRNSWEKFYPCSPNRLLFTKLDEAVSFGGSIALILESQLPVCYLSNGQEVPSNLRLAKPEELAALVFGIGNGRF
ncbi:MAG: AAA family ATPase [Planctomycetota bacterium]|nr:MAG: AAA family ATPase [Planctomycetota bacterium]